MTRESASHQTTDTARLDEALADNENLRRMASSFAHDFNNLLAVITGYSELMLRKLRPDDPLRGRVESIKKATEWGIALAQQILAASRKQGTAATASVSLNQAVTNVTRVLQPALGERIELVTRLDPAAGQVAINQGQLGQIVMNLVVNARDAMPEGGRLAVETAAAGAEIVLSVSDTGVGMDEETRARLFEPYFTTKEPGKGMGLGLATVYDVVMQSGGRIEVASAPGRGSTFTIFLPRVEDDAEGANGSPPGVPAAAVKPLTVLVVEDEAEVRELIREILQFDRHVVLEARDREEALALSERHKEPIDLLIADVVLPGSLTDDLVRCLTASRPGIRVLYVSGYLDDTEEIESIPRVGPIVQKPFTVAALTQAVREVVLGAK